LVASRTGRPVLAVVGDEAQLVFSDLESTVWKSRLRDASAHLVSAARAVGRIEVEGHSLAWLGTGWLVRPDVVVTNRHVAAEFGRNDGTSFGFKQGISGSQMNASVDFLRQEAARSGTIDRVGFDVATPRLFDPWRQFRIGGGVP
jgi:endonuclease G